MKVSNLAIRAAVFASGIGLLLFGWHRSHTEIIDPLAPPSQTTGGAAEVLAVIGLFLAVLAFMPSAERVGRWASRKRRHQASAAHFKRRRKT